MLDVKDVAWAEFALWAPSAIRANGRYYLFFAANDIQSDQEEGGIGVAVADRPEGPFRDALGKPLIGTFHNGAQPIDPFVFRDDDGQHYLYYGGWRHCNIVRLTPDLLGVMPFPDGATFKEITPANYVEGPFVFKRNGKYYLMWSEGGWHGPELQRGLCHRGLRRRAPSRASERCCSRILPSQPAPGTIPSYPLPDPTRGTSSTTGGRSGRRTATIARSASTSMRFNADGTIQPVKITFEGVKARPLPTAR